MSTVEYMTCALTVYLQTCDAWHTLHYARRIKNHSFPILSYIKRTLCWKTRPITLNCVLLGGFFWERDAHVLFLFLPPGNVRGITLENPQYIVYCRQKRDSFQGKRRPLKNIVDLLEKAPAAAKFFS